MRTVWEAIGDIAKKDGAGGGGDEGETHGGQRVLAMGEGEGGGGCVKPRKAFIKEFLGDERLAVVLRFVFSRRNKRKEPKKEPLSEGALMRWKTSCLSVSLSRPFCLSYLSL